MVSWYPDSSSVTVERGILGRLRAYATRPIDGREKARPILLDRAGARFSRPIALGVLLLAVVVFAFFLWVQATDPRYASLWGVDRTIYREAGLRVLSGGSWFYPEQVTGLPYEVLVGHVMYPPAAMLWLVPAALLPDILWWAVPLSVITVVVIRLRPSPWGWAGIGLCLAYPPTSQMLVSGNPGLWIAAACSLGTVWRPAYALVFAKPSLFPFALIGVRDRRWLAIVAFGLAVTLLMLPLTLQWLGAVVNARGQFSGPLYALRDLGWVTLPLAARYVGTRNAGTPRLR